MNGDEVYDQDTADSKTPSEAEEKRSSESAVKPTPEPLVVPAREANWKLRAALAGMVVLAVLIAAILSATVLPTWWSERIVNRVDGSWLAGALYGLFMGLTFTLVPLLVFRQIFRSMRGSLRGVVAATAVVLALPNLFTLAVVLGSSSSANAAQRSIEVGAPGFLGGTSWGAVLAVAIALVIFLGLWRWARDRRTLQELKDERRTAQIMRDGDASL